MNFQAGFYIFVIVSLLTLLYISPEVKSSNEDDINKESVQRSIDNLAKKLKFLNCENEKEISIHRDKVIEDLHELNNLLDKVSDH